MTVLRWIESFDNPDDAKDARDAHAATLVNMGLTPHYTVAVRPQAGAYAVVVCEEETNQDADR